MIFEVESTHADIQKTIELPAFPRVGERIHLYVGNRLLRCRVTGVIWANASFVYGAELEVEHPAAKVGKIDVAISCTENIGELYEKHVAG